MIMLMLLAVEIGENQDISFTRGTCVSVGAFSKHLQLTVVCKVFF